MEFLRNKYSLLALAVLVLIALWIYFSQSTQPSKPAKYVIGYDASWFPLRLYDKESGITGFSLDLVHAIAQDQGINMELLSIPSNDLLRGVDLGNYSGALSSLSLFQALNDKYLPSDPYFLLGPVLVVSEKSPIKSLNDLEGKSLGMIFQEGFISALNKYSSIHFVYYDESKLSTMFDDLMKNKIDGLIYNLIPSREFIKFYKGDLKIVSSPLTNEGLRLISKNDPASKELIQHFNEGLRSIKAKGIYDQLLKKWSL